MALCLVVTLPLEFIFGARVWRRPKRLAIALAPVFAVFVVWDLWASSRGTWAFNSDYTIGVNAAGRHGRRRTALLRRRAGVRSVDPRGSAQHPFRSRAAAAGQGSLMPPPYPTLAVLVATAVIVLELIVVRSRLFKQRAYWISMAIVFAFMVPVDGWLTKQSAPIVLYRERDTSGIRPVWDIPLEEFAYAFALITAVILVWDRSKDVT